MNEIASYSTLSPHGKDEECAKFTIDDVTNPYILSNVMTSGQEYTFSLWVKSDATGSISTVGSTISTSTEWERHILTFESETADLNIYFQADGMYYIYHPQLEIGNKTTDYAPAPEDSESRIQQLSDSISMMVAGLKSISLMEQTKDGWTFSLGSIQDTLDATADAAVADLKQSLYKLGTYVKIATYEDEPCIELGAGDSDFKLLITNTRIMFKEGSAIPTYISNQTMYIDKLQVETELQQGNFLWTQRANGNLGLIWKGGTS